jgi:integrase
LQLERSFLIDIWILHLDTSRMSKPDAGKNPNWQSTQYSNLIRYVPSGTYYARLRVLGKLIRKSLKTKKISVAKLRLSDLERTERQNAEHQIAATDGRQTFGQASETYKERLKGDASLKPRTKEYHEERLKALLKSWPDLGSTELRKITKSNCLNWAAKFGQKSSPTAFNHTISVLRHILEIGVETGVRYDNPARFIKRASERPKKLQLPESSQFGLFVTEIENGGGGYSKPCAELVRFLAYGGFRKTEAGFIAWTDCNFAKGKIGVRGDPVTGTKNSEFREVPMIPEMRQMLERMRKERAGESSETPVMRVRECQKAMDRAAKKLGMSRITHHDLRHLFATRCIESGVDIPTVSRWLGHKDGGALAMRVYGHLRDQHSVEMAQRVIFS